MGVEMENNVSSELLGKNVVVVKNDGFVLVGILQGIDSNLIKLVLYDQTVKYIPLQGISRIDLNERDGVRR